MFLSHPSVKDEPDLEGRTAFMWAAGKGSDDVICTMLALSPHIDINMADKYGGTGERLSHFHPSVCFQGSVTDKRLGSRYCTSSIP